MFSRLSIRLTVAAFVITVLGSSAPAARAESRRGPERADSRITSLVDRLEDVRAWIGHRFSLPSPRRAEAPVLKCSGGLDPNGRPCPAPPPCGAACG